MRCDRYLPATPLGRTKADLASDGDFVEGDVWERMKAFGLSNRAITARHALRAKVR
jgi:hypothetical protein